MFVIDDVNRGAFHFVTKCLSLSLSLCLSLSLSLCLSVSLSLCLSLSLSLSLAVGRTMDRHFVKKTEAEAKVEAPFRLSPLTRSVNTSALSFPRRGFPDRFGVDDDDDGGGGGDVEFQMRRLSFFCTITDRHANDVTNAVTQLHSCLPACLPACLPHGFGPISPHAKEKRRRHCRRRRRWMNGMGCVWEARGVACGDGSQHGWTASLCVWRMSGHLGNWEQKHHFAPSPPAATSLISCTTSVGVSAAARIALPFISDDDSKKLSILPSRCSYR